MLEDRKWLEKINYETDKYPLFAAPFVCEYKGKPHVCATDGHMIVLIQGDGDDLPKADKTHTDGVSAVMGHIEDTKPKSVDFTALKAWAGKSEWDRVCQMCKGEGTMPPCSKCGHELQCESCDGSGGDYPFPRYGKLFGIAINCNLLARGLAGIDANRETTVHLGGEKAVQFISGEGWIIGLMPCWGVNTENNFTEEILCRS